MRQAISIVLAAVAASLAIACTQPSHQPTFVQSRDGMTAYLGVVPTEIVRAHTPEHTERRMHAAEPLGNAHLVVAIYDDATGARIENAAVEAVLRGERHGGGRRLRLEPMRIEGSITYGGYVSVDTNSRYHVDLSIRPSPSGPTRRMTFLFDAASLARAGPERP